LLLSLLMEAFVAILLSVRWRFLLEIPFARYIPFLISC
jgi:hypothetical protein